MLDGNMYMFRSRQGLSEIVVGRSAGCVPVNAQTGPLWNHEILLMMGGGDCNRGDYSLWVLADS